MSEQLEQRANGYQEVFQSICQEFGSANVVGLLVSCFGEELTGNALDHLGVAAGMSGIQLVKIYGNNRNFEYKGDLQ